MLDETGCDAIMVGRGAQGNPWIFREILSYLETGEIISPPTVKERKQKSLEHLDLLIEFKGEHRGIQEGRKHIAWYFKGVHGGAELRSKINRACTRNEMREIILSV